MTPLLDYRSTGSGIPLVLVHGALCDLRMWEPVVPFLDGAFEVFTYSQRYFGRNPWQQNAPPFSYQTHANDLVQFIERVVQRPAHVVAWSYGADVALLAAKLEPRCFLSAYYYELGRHTHICEPEQLAIYEAEAQAMFGTVFAGLSDPNGILPATAMLIDQSAGETGYFQRQSTFQRAIQTENASTLPLQLQQLSSLEVTCDDIKAISFPCCFAQGSQTRPLFKIATDIAYACSMQQQQQLIAGTTHMLPIEQPQLFAERVLTFIQSVSSEFSK